MAEGWKPWWRSLLAAALLLLSAAAVAEPAATDDPFLWLEEVEGARAMDWVRRANARYLPELEGEAGFAGWRRRAEAILEDPRRITMPSGVSPSALDERSVFNFWRDEQHVRGLWRRSDRASYEAGAPKWTTLLDLDALEAAEQANLQFAGASCLPPDNDHCLVRLSVGGRDAVEIREFDLAARRFVPAGEGGFFSPAAKQSAVWLDADHLLVATAAGPVTTSGYAREVRLWARGTPFAASRLLLSIPERQLAAEAAVFGHGAGRRAVLIAAETFWTAKISHLLADGTLAPSPLPPDADFRFIADLGDGARAYALLRTGFEGIPEGSLVSYMVPADAPPGAVELVLTPASSQAVNSVEATGRALYVNLLDDVAARLLRLSRATGEWRAEAVPLPENRALSLVAGDDDDALYAELSGFAEPSQLVRIKDGAAPAPLAAAPAFFDGSKVEVTQRFATSKDGTRIPYFLVRPQGATGPLKTYLWSYGGFEIPLVPAYLAPDALLWVEGGNQYVVANIRGGGEYGPRWHRAALLEKRQNSYDDLHAVAEDLKRQGLASKIAVHGRSNGGLMAAVAYTERPDLYDAALVGVPLADMKRYHLLLAGASWMAEYGDPESADWAYIRRYSPYQNIKADARYPRVFFYTSTKDDRVHPGHARKMAARMEEQGHPIYYYENVDGGHAGVANLKEAAYRYALMLAYLHRELQ